MAVSYPVLFFLTTLASATFLVAGLNYYLRTRQDALTRRLEELQEQSLTGGAGPLLGGDFWDTLLRATYGSIFGRGWFRQKELELMRAGFRGPRVVKVYGVVSLAFIVTLVATALFVLQGEDLSIWLLGLAAALVFGYFIPEQVLVYLRN